MNINDKKVKSTIRITLCCALVMIGMPTVNAQPQRVLTLAESQQLLLDKLYISELLAKTVGQVLAQERIEVLKQQVEKMNVNQILMFAHQKDYDYLRSKLDELMIKAENITLANLSTNKVEIDDGTSPNAACENYTPALVEVTLSDKFIANGIIAGAKWACLEAVFGENAASTCIALEVAAVITDAGFVNGEFCLKNQNDSINTNMYGTITSIGEDMNEFLDAKFSDQASQTSVNTVQNSMDTANHSMDNNFPALDSNLSTALDDLDQANNQLNNLYAKAESLLSRVQINQIEIETIAISASDIQQSAEEIRDDTQTLISSVSSTLVQLTELHLQTQSLVSLSATEQIEFAMVRNVSKAPLNYQLPAIYSGQLEEVREVLINKMSKVEALGGKISKVQELLVVGDTAFNTGQYKSAYSSYAGAYKALLEVSF